MNYDLLNQMGLGNIDITYFFLISYVLIFILLILVIVQTVRLSKLSKRYKKFMSGKNANSLEKDIVGLYEDNKFVKASMEKNKKDIQNLYRKLESAYQKIGIVKYDAFDQMGGQLSFSLALLDENDNGFILNSVHSTEGCYSYTKEIKNGLCDISLGDEEKKALDIAMDSEI
jgi:biopolymer transport protein ExbB/TolQ